MLLSLRMSQVTALIRVNGQAKATLVGAQVVLHKVRILAQVYGLQGELPKPLTSLGIRLALGEETTAARLPALSMLKVHTEEQGGGTSSSTRGMDHIREHNFGKLFTHEN